MPLENQHLCHHPGFRFRSSSGISKAFPHVRVREGVGAGRGVGEEMAAQGQLWHAYPACPDVQAAYSCSSYGYCSHAYTTCRKLHREKEKIFKHWLIPFLLFRVSQIGFSEDGKFQFYTLGDTGESKKDISSLVCALHEHDVRCLWAQSHLEQRYRTPDHIGKVYMYQEMVVTISEPHSKCTVKHKQPDKNLDLGGLLLSKQTPKET